MSLRTAPVVALLALVLIVAGLFGPSHPKLDQPASALNQNTASTDVPGGLALLDDAWAGGLQARLAQSRDGGGGAARDSKPLDRAATPPTPELERLRNGLPVLTPPLIDCCIEVAREIDPELGAQLAALRAKDPAEFERRMRTDERAARKLLALCELKRKDPDLYSIRKSELAMVAQVNRVKVELCRAKQAGNQQQIDALTNQLRNLLTIQQVNSIKVRADSLCRLEERVKELREEIDHEARIFHETIDARMKKLCDQGEDNGEDSLVPADPSDPHAVEKP